MAGKKEYPSQREILKWLRYDPSNGKLYHKPRMPSDIEADCSSRKRQVCKTWNTRFAGKRADFEHVNGYFYAHIPTGRYLAHRLIWIIENGSEPNFIDHKDRNKSNNRISNLRSVTHSENHRNRPAKSLGKQPGVRWVPKRDKYQARIMVKRKGYHLGYFDKYDDAVAARIAAEKQNSFAYASA